MATTTMPACTLGPSLLTQSPCRGPISRSQAFKTQRPRRMQVRAEESKQGEKEQAGKDKDPVNKGGNAYIDELPVSVGVAFCKLRI
jgi:hypothetical protein